MWDHAILAEANRRQSLLYAGSFLPGAKIFFLFVLGDVLYLLGGTYQALVIAANQLRFHVIQNITAQLVMILIAWLTIPRLGMTGAAVATIIAQVLLFASTSAFLALRYGVRPGARTTGVTAYLLAALVVVGVVGAPGLQFSLLGLARAATIEIVVIAGLALFLSRDDWRRVGRLIFGALTPTAPPS